MRKFPFLLIMILELLIQCSPAVKLEKSILYGKKFVIPVLSPEYEKLSSEQLEDIRKIEDESVPVYNSEKHIKVNRNYATSVSIQEYDVVKKQAVEYKFYIADKDPYNPNENYDVYNNSDNINDSSSLTLPGDGFYIKKYYNLSIGGNNFYCQEYPTTVTKAYNADGGLLWKIARFESVILQKYVFNDKGQIIEKYKYDYSEKYNLSLLQVLKILENNKIAYLRGICGAHSSSMFYPAETNKGKIWYLNNLLGRDPEEHIIIDNNGEIISQMKIDQNGKSMPPSKFLLMTKERYKEDYDGKSIEDVEKETGLQIFIYDKIN